MSNKKVKINVGLDFTADNMSLDKIRDQMDLAFKAMKINLDPASYKKAEAQLKELGRIAERSLNNSSGKMNFKAMEQQLANSNIIGNLNEFDKSLISMGVNGTKSINAIKTSNDYLHKSLSDSNTVLNKMGTTLMNTIRWNISASAVNAVVGEFQKAYNFAKDLDRSLTDIRIVSGLSADNMSRFAVAANKSARELKVSTIDYAQAALVFYQQGLNAMEVQNMTKAAIIGGNITGESTEEMSNLLTSVMNGYKIATEDILKVTDKLAAVGAETAADFYELATAMSKVASMASAAGVPIDQLNAQIATIVSVTKESPESIGTSLKTIYGRMLAFKVDSDALMKDEDGEVFGAPKVEEALQAYNKVTGAQISLFKVSKDGKRELRELGDVITEIGDSWGSTNDNITKFGLSTALAGSRQQNRLVALFDSWDMYKDAVETSLDAEGTSLRQNEIYMDSYQGKLKGLQAAKEQLYIGFTSSDGLKSFIDGLTTALNLFSKISDQVGSLGGVLGVLGAIIAKPALVAVSKVSLNTTGAGTGSGKNATAEETKNKEHLIAINKAYGAEEANRLRMALKGAAEEHQAHMVKQEDLNKEASLLEEIKVIMSSKAVSDAKAQSIRDLEDENNTLTMTKGTITEIAQAYANMGSLDEKLNGLLLESITEKNKATVYAAIEETEMELDRARAQVEEIESRVGSLRTEALGKDDLIDAAAGKKGGMQKDLTEAGAAAEKLNKQTQAIQAGMMLILPTLTMAKDSTNSWGEVMATIPKMMLPMLPTIIKNIGGVQAALVGVTGTTKILGVVLNTALGPIGWAALAAAALGTALHFAAKQAHAYRDAVSRTEEAVGILEQAQSQYDGVLEKITSIKEQKKEILALTKEDGVNRDAELANLEEQVGLLEQEKVLQEFSLNMAREKAELAALETAQTKMTSEYIYSQSANSQNALYSRVTVVEELNAVNEAYNKHTEKIAEMTAEMDQMDEGTKKEIAAKQAMKQKIEEEIAKRNDAKDAMARHTASIIENNKHLGDSTEEAKKARRESEEVVKTSTDLMQSSMALTGSTKDNSDAIDKNSISLLTNSEIKAINDEKMEKLNDQYMDASDNIQTFTAFLDELNSKEGLSVKSKQDIITKHKELLPFINDEKELRKQLMAIIQKEEEVQRQAYINMIMVSEDFFNAKIKGNKDLVDKLGEYYDADLENAKTLAEAKAMVEAKLIENLAKQWAKFYQVSAIAGEGYVQTMGAGGLIDDTGRNMVQNMASEMRKVSSLFDDIVVGFGLPDFKGINASGVKTGKSSGSSSSSTKDDRQFLESLDAQIRAIKIKNDHLLKTEQSLQEQLKLAKDIEGIEGLNKQYRITGEIIAHNETMLESFKKEQDLIHARANTIRSENSKYNTENWFDSNAEQSTAYIEQYNKATKKQQDEMDILFGKIQKLKKAWIESGSEADKILEINKELSRELDNQHDKVKKATRDLIEQEKRNAYLDLEYRQRLANEQIKAAKSDMESAVRGKQNEIDSIQDEIDRIQESESARQESLDRSRQLEEISKLQNRYYYLQYENLTKITEEQARALGLEKERTRQLEYQKKLQELKLEMHELESKITKEPATTIEHLEAEISLLEQQEKYKKEQETRQGHLEEISKLEDKHYYLQNDMLGKITKEQAEAVGLEQERESYLESQLRIQELLVKIENTRRQKNIQQLTKKADGTWDFEYVADQKEISDLNKQIEDEQNKHKSNIESIKEQTLDNLKKAQEVYDEWERQNRLAQHLEELRAEVVRLKRIEELRVQIEQMETDHNEAIKELTREALESLKKSQEDYDEWERQNDIRRQIEDKQRRIQDYQDEIKDLQDKFAEKEKLTNEAFALEKENLDRYYSDMDTLTNTKLTELKETFGENWSAIYDVLTGFFGEIGSEYDTLMKKLSTSLPTPEYSAGGQGFYTPSSSSSGNSANLGKGVATGQSAKDNESKLNSDAAFKQSEIARTQSVISSRKNEGISTSEQEKYLARLVSGSYDNGGKITKTGLTLNDFHGTERNPEWIFNDTQLQKILKSAVLSTMNIAIPKMPTIALSGASGGVSQSITIKEIVFPNIHDAKEIEGAIKSLSTYANQWANQK